jgi:deoxycytidylate deaminase
MINEAIRLAKKNPVHKYKFCSIITTKRGRIVAEGYNSFSRTHTMQYRYGSRHTSSEACFLHSEVAALLKAKGSGHTIYVARVNKQNIPAMARPCGACMAAIEQESTIKRIVYTISENEYGTINIER